MKKQWKRLAALSSAAVMAAGTLLYFPTDTLQNISWGITASAEETGAVKWTKIEDDNLTWTLYNNGTLTISGSGAMQDYDYNSPAFYNSNIKKVVIEDGVTSIGDNAFPNCAGLESIEIPSGVTSIGDFAFSRCSSLTSITIPSSVTSIEASAFEDCSSLTSITILGDVTSIGYNAFSDCTSLTSITIPKSVKSIENNAFSGCTALTEVLLEGGSTLTYTDLGVDANKVVTRWNEGDLTWSLTADGTMTISGKGAMKDYNSADNSPAYDNSNIIKVVIEDGITSIGNDAFSVCTGLTSITIPDSVTSIGNSAFSDCISLTGITISKSVASIGSNVFDGCTALTKVFLEGGSTLTSESFGEVASKIATYWNEDNLTWTLTADGTMTISGSGAMKAYDTDDSPAT